MFIDSIIKRFIKQAKISLDKGEISKDDYSKALTEIFLKTQEFNGVTLDEFYKGLVTGLLL